MATNNPFSIKPSKPVFGPQTTANPFAQQADAQAKLNAAFAQQANPQPQGTVQTQQLRDLAAENKARADAAQAKQNMGYAKQTVQPNMPPAQANMAAVNQTAKTDAAIQGGRSQNAPKMVSGREVMQRPPTLQPVQGGLVDGQATKTGISPENRNIKQTMGTGLIASQMNRPA